MDDPGMWAELSLGADAMLGRSGIPALVVDASGAARWFNAAWVSAVGKPAGEPWAWLDSAEPMERERIRRDVAHVRGHGSPVETELTLRAPDGGRVDVVLASAEVGGRDSDDAVIVMAWDVTRHRENEERLAFMAGHDSLTGLANRRAFSDSLERAVRRAERGVPSVLMLFDVDRLKAFNDLWGHASGDQALVNTALLIRRHIRAADLPARIGGDEFAVLLEGSTLDGAVAIAERIRRSAAADEMVQGAHDARLGLSCGVTVIDTSITDGHAALERADRALYAAKAAGRDRVVVWSQELVADPASDRIAVLIRDAFTTDALSLVYQPVVRLADSSVAYFESLARLTRRDGRVLSAPEFLPVAERLGLMSKVSRRVVELAVEALIEVPDVNVSVNVSDIELADELLLAEIVELVDRSGIAAGRLIFEVPESALLANPVAGRRWMESVSAAGCRCVLDDFGTGTGMLVLLCEPDIDQVKLSRTVTLALAAEDVRRDFVLALRDLIESQGKDAVATYLESERLLGQAKDAGFEFGQGFGLEVPSSDLAALAAGCR
jgi:diguanylate cyclase (GGDEF)-like protein